MVHWTPTGIEPTDYDDDDIWTPSVSDIVSPTFRLLVFLILGVRHSDS